MLRLEETHLRDNRIISKTFKQDCKDGTSVKSSCKTVKMAHLFMFNHLWLEEGTVWAM